MWKIVFILCIICDCTRCQQNILSYWIMEGPSSVQFSINVASDSGLGSKIADSALQKAQFKIVQSSINNVFSINSTTGVLTPTGQIDREVICPQAKDCNILMDISILSPPDYFEIIKIRISVNDTNDNSPAFETNLFEIPIPENAAIGSTFTIIKAIDLDSPDNGVKGYRLLDTAIEISLKTTINSDGTIQPVIELQTKLDREAKSSFQFQLEAFDSVESSTSNSAILTVTVNVKDVNDNPPMFTKDNYLLAVLENTPLQRTLIQVHATDPDIGDNGQLVYSFDSLTSSQYSSILKISSDNGDIVLVNKLDYESIQTIELNVLAIEKNPTHMPAKCKVKITVEDVNDNEPTITVNPVSNTQDHIEIKENVKIGAFLAHISVSDKDSGNNGQVFCTIYTPNDPGVFELHQLSSNDYKLLTNTSIDRETKAEYDVVFVCRDGGIPSLSADHQTKVIILDENDHVPVFTQDQFTLEIYENNPVGHEILYLNVTDLDSGKNGEVVFQVLSGPQHYITLDPYTGNITARSSFDYEQAQFVTYEIIAYDQGDISYTATATVSINILDTNDEPPQFMMPEYTFSVSENLKLGADVGQVQAFDPDSKSNSKFQFELVYGSPNFNLFVIEPSSGAIFTRATFDREVKDSYSIKVKVVDTFLPSLFSITDITVNIDDQNDHKPEIEFPNENNNTFVITSNPSDHSKALTQIIATDADIGINSELEYSIISGNDASTFLVDETTGYIYIKDIQKLYKSNQYELNILVKDTGLPSLNSQTILNIIVEAQPEVLAVNTVIIITVGVLSGIIVSSLVIAILLIKMRMPKKKKYQGNDVNGPGLPDHYTVQPVEDCRMGDDVSELSVSVLSTSQHQANDQESTTRLSPNSLMQIAQSPQITTYDHTMFTESRDKFSDGSNSDSGLGSHEEGIAVISSPVISMDMRYQDQDHNHTMMMIQSSPNRQQISPNFQSNNNNIQPLAKRHLSFTNNNKPPPPPYHIIRGQPNNNNTKDRDDINTTKKTVSHQYPYREEKHEDFVIKDLPQKQHQRSNSYNASHHYNAHQGSSAHLEKGKGHNENRQSPAVWENNPKGDSQQQKYKHLSYAESVHENNDVAGHEISLFNRDHNGFYNNHSPKEVMSKVNGSKSVKHESKSLQHENRENMNTNCEQDKHNILAEDSKLDKSSNKNKCNEKIAVVAPARTIHNTANFEDSKENAQFQTFDNHNKNTPLKKLENQTVSYNNNNNNSSSKSQIPLCLSNDNLNRYPRDETIVDTSSKNNQNSQNFVCNISSLTASNKNDEQLSPLSTSSSKHEEETNSQQEFTGVTFVEFDSDHEENIV